jgi:gliding motility-associated-like protein
MKYFLILLFVTSGCIAQAQTVIYSETFDPAPGWTLNVPTGTNGADPNFWEIDADEGGVLPPGCGVAGGNNTLHITSVFFPAGGASYDAGGLCGLLFCPETAARAESPNISTIGHTNLTLTFDYIAGGDPGIDEGTVWYNDGGGWTQLGGALFTPVCPSGQGQWTAYSMALPASCDNIANLQIGFNWVNNDDAVGTDPSIAINNIEITKPSTTTTPPIASFIDPGALCVGDCINLDASGSTAGTNPITTYSWTVSPGAGAPAIANGVNPTNICWNTAGTYDITLTVDDGTDTDDTTIQVVISNCALPVASFLDPGTLCVGDCINLDASASSQGANGPITTYSWVVAPGAGAPAIANGVNPTNICWNTAGTYDITLTVDDGTDTDDTTIQIVVNTCSVPTASFQDPGALCVGDCIDLDAANSTQGSNGPLTSYTWVVAPGAGAPVIANGVNPTNICWNTAGTYDITLTVGDGVDTDDTTIQVVVTNCTQPEASFVAPGPLCIGDCIGLDGSASTQGSNGPLTTYTWTVAPGAGAPAIPNGMNPANVCWNTAGTYDITLTVGDGTDTDDTTIQVVVNACNVPVADFSFPTTICAGDCIDFMDLSTGTPTTWEWTFNGATPSTSSDQNPTMICFPVAGTFDVTLIAGNSSGSDTLTVAVTVNALPVVNAGPDVTITIGEAVTLNPAGPPGNYVWSPIIGLSCDVCLSPDASPLQTTEYTITVTDANGCSGSDNVIVNVNVVEGIGVPNAFSPNGDGNNDILFVKGNGIERMTFSVYNRYGQKVFESTDQTVGWDGTHNGTDVNSGVFVYVVEYQFFGEDIQKITGNVTLTK